MIGGAKRNREDKGETCKLNAEKACSSGKRCHTIAYGAKVEAWGGVWGTTTPHDYHQPHLVSSNAKLLAMEIRKLVSDNPKGRRSVQSKN
jgi:hypothetical protein